MNNKEQVMKEGLFEFECGCKAFKFITEPDDTGAIIEHQECCKINIEFIQIEELGAFKKQFPDTKVKDDNSVEPNEDDTLIQMLADVNQICMYAPLFDPERKEHILKKIKEKYNIKISRK